MARTYSTMSYSAGEDLIDFTLLDVISGKERSLSSYIEGSRGSVVMFICNHCPYVKHIWSELLVVIQEYQAKGISFVAINSNDVENYPEDSPLHMKALFTESGLVIPYFFDETQEVAKKYDAACTPDFYLFSKERKLFSCGRFDESNPKNNEKVTGKDLRSCLDKILKGEKVLKEDQPPSIGCNIKWKTS